MSIIAGSAVTEIPGPGDGYIKADSADIFTNKELDAEATGNSVKNLKTTNFKAGVMVTDLTGATVFNDTQIPSALAVDKVLDTTLKFQGTWNAETNTPALASGVGTKGFTYTVSNPGTTALDGISSWAKDDQASFDGTAWRKLLGSEADKTSIVVSTLKANDIGQATANTTALQTLLDSSGPAKFKLMPGVYSVKDGADPLSNIQLNDYQTLEIGEGAILQGRVNTSDGFSRYMLTNDAWNKNAIPILSYTHVEETFLWFNTITFDIGAVTNPFDVGKYIYVRSAYTTGDTTNFFNYIYLVVAVDNTDANHKKVIIQLPLASDAEIPATGNLICYEANAYINVEGAGFAEQFAPSRPPGTPIYQQLVLNKVLNCYVNMKVITRFASDSRNGSAHTTTVCMVNAFDSVIDRCNNAGGPQAVQLFGPCSGIDINSVGGVSKDDLIAIFTSGALTPHKDLDGTINSRGPIYGINIDGKGKVHRHCSSSTIDMVSDNGDIIDAVSIKNFTAINTQMFLTMQTVVGSNGVYGTISVRDCDIQPKDNNPIFWIGNGWTGNGTSVTVKKLYVDNLNVTRGPGTSKGLFGANGALLSVGGSTTITIDEFNLNNSTILYDLDRVQVGMALWQMGNVTMSRLIMNNCKIGGTGSGSALNGIRLNSPNARLTYAEFVSCQFGFNFQNVITNVLGTIPTRIVFNKCSSFAPNMRAFLGFVPTNSSVQFINCDFSGLLNGAIYNNQALAHTLNIHLADNYNSGTARPFIDASVGSLQTFNITSGGGNRLPNQTIAGAGRTWNFIGNCSDLRVDVTLIARVDGTIIYNTNAAAGTLGVAGLVICQGTAANSWKLMSDPTKTF